MADTVHRFADFLTFLQDDSGEGVSSLDTSSEIRASPEPTCSSAEVSGQLPPHSADTVSAHTDYRIIYADRLKSYLKPEPTLAAVQEDCETTEWTYYFSVRLGSSE